MVILCAEDDVWVQHIIWKLLTADGFKVLNACDGEAALEVSRQYRGSIDLLLADVEMPRMDGLELSANIAAERPQIKALLMSGYPDGRERASVSGLPFLQKPFTPAALRYSIGALLGPVHHVNTTLGCDARGFIDDIEILRTVLIAYRAKVAALLSILEGGVKAHGNKPMAPMPRQRSRRWRKPPGDRVGGGTRIC
jgi:CheY-like chemotaxis protein